MKKEALILKWQKEMDSLSDKLDEDNDIKRTYFSSRYHTISYILEDIKSLDGNTVKWNSVCLSYACGNNKNNKCQLEFDYSHCCARQTE